MKKSESIIGALKLEGVRFWFKQLRKDLFFDRYVTAGTKDQAVKQQVNQKVVYVNQHTGREYSFPQIPFRGR